MSLKFPLSLAGKRASALTGPFSTSLYDFNDNLLVSIDGDIPAFWNFLDSPYSAYRIEIGTSCTSIGAYAVSYNTTLKGSLNIPDSVTSIADGAFFGNSFDGTLTIPNSLNRIENSAFAANNFTGTLNIPDSVTSIAYGAFSGNNFTGTLVIPAGVTSIGNIAFQYCRFFTGTLVIPAGVTSIGNSAFRECTGLTRIEILATTAPTFGNSVFLNVAPSDGQIHVPAGATGYAASYDGYTVVYDL